MDKLGRSASTVDGDRSNICTRKRSETGFLGPNWAEPWPFEGVNRCVGSADGQGSVLLRKAGSPLLRWVTKMIGPPSDNR